jgi:dUTP pyrophosphatase
MSSYILDLGRAARDFFNDLVGSLAEPEPVTVDIMSVDSPYPLPRYSTPGSAGVDLVANISAKIIIGPGKMVMIPTGIKIGIRNPHLVAMIYPRSGKSTRDGLILANGTGVIDSDYRGEIMVAALNRNLDTPCHVAPGERIAQMVFLPVAQPIFNVVSSLDETERGSGGFGSTGAK